MTRILVRVSSDVSGRRLHRPPPEISTLLRGLDVASRMVTTVEGDREARVIAAK